MVFLGGAPVIFRSKYQKTVALSSAEAEYMALSLCTQEVVWTRQLLHDLGGHQQEPTVIYEDNQGAIALARNVGYHARSKHIDIRHHFVRERLHAGDIKIEYVPTAVQLADILTKALSTSRFTTLRDAVGLTQDARVGRA
jgi:hypothetical protein